MYSVIILARKIFHFSPAERIGPLENVIDIDELQSLSQNISSFYQGVDVHAVEDVDVLLCVRPDGQLHVGVDRDRVGPGERD